MSIYKLVFLIVFYLSVYEALGNKDVISYLRSCFKYKVEEELLNSTLSFLESKPASSAVTLTALAEWTWFSVRLIKQDPRGLFVGCGGAVMMYAANVLVEPIYQIYIRVR